MRLQLWMLSTAVSSLAPEPFKANMAGHLPWYYLGIPQVSEGCKLMTMGELATETVSSSTCMPVQLCLRRCRPTAVCLADNIRNESGRWSLDSQTAPIVMLD
jgi:hypothetical protein